MTGLVDYWPLFGLRIVTPRLEIRLPTDDDLPGLLEEIIFGVHDPESTPFSHAWTDVASPQRERDSLQWWWRQRAQWSPANWNFSGAVFVDGKPVGVQDLIADNFFVLRAVSTGSWLGLRHQGQGIGKEMRAAILHLAFGGLGAIEANSGAWHDNPRSRGVSDALGYELNGASLGLRRDKPDTMINLRLSRDIWETRRRDDIEIIGLEACLELFGARQPE
jgi:RimJ/RimL family protein N-acetyltransferase